MPSELEMLAHRGRQTYESVFYGNTNCAHETIALYQLFEIMLFELLVAMKYVVENGSITLHCAADFAFDAKRDVNSKTLSMNAKWWNSRLWQSLKSQTLQLNFVPIRHTNCRCDVLFHSKRRQLWRVNQFQTYFVQRIATVHAMHVKPTACVKLFSLTQWKSHHHIITHFKTFLTWYVLG